MASGRKSLRKIAMRRFAYIGSLIAVAIAATPSPAVADWLLTPYVGGALFDITDTGTRPVFGGSIAWMGPVAGFELDLADAPTFLEGKSGLAIDNRNLFTLMGNAVVQFPTASRRIRPYAVAGIGAIHTKITTPGDTVLIEDENLGVNVGGGVTALLNDRVGLRGDLRYVRAIRNDDATAAADALEVSALKLLRFTVGVTFRF
jgi:opacity protein-like surface antigen